MSELHADLTELLQFAQNIKIAVNSVMATKNSIMQKYQQLGVGWNDKKYKELGDIVQECNKALNNVLKTLQQSGKYVSTLAKSLQEYENMSLDRTRSNDTSIVGFLVNSVVNHFSTNVRLWNEQLEQLSTRLQQLYRQKYGGIISEEKINRPLCDTVSYETTALFRSRGMEGGVLGYNDGFQSHIAVGTGHELQTTIHENLHQLSANGNRHGIIICTSQGRSNVQMNEAITELLTQRTLGEQYGPDYSAYSDNRDAMAVIESVMGEDTISRAYFQNRPELMQQMFDSILGYGSWEQLSEAFDDCLDCYPLTRSSGRTRRDDLINRFVLASNTRSGGNENWNDLL